MNPLAWVAKKINAVSYINLSIHLPSSLIFYCATQSMEDPMAREEKLITYLHTAQQAAEDRCLLACFVSTSPYEFSLPVSRRVHYSMPAVSSR
jgi:hypothetical protein